jgi:phosphoglycolate phosphatase-like HAD superfamily hydrolase
VGLKLAVDLDAVLGDTRSLWRDWLADAARVLGIEPGALPDDRAAAAAELDRVGAGNWRTLLERYAADRAPIYLRPNADVAAALRRLGSNGARVAVYTDAPEELARLAVAHLGAERRVESLHAGAGAQSRALAALGSEARSIRSRDVFLDAAGGG